MSKAFLYGVGRKPALLGSKTITENGIYGASADNLDGYASVDVNVSGGGGSYDPTDPVSVYRATRPSSWLPVNLPSEMEILYPDEDRMEILLDVSSDIKVASFSIVSTVIGVIVEWGDGTSITSTATSQSFYKQYTDEVTSHVVVTLRAPKNSISTISFSTLAKYTNPDGIVTNLNSNRSRGLLEISILAPNCTTLGLSGDQATTYSKFRNLAYFSAKVGATSYGNTFTSCINLLTLPEFSTPPANFLSIFDGCTSLITIPLLNTSISSNFYRLFYYCNRLEYVPLLNTSSVTNVSYMFYACSSLREVPLFDLSNVSFSSAEHMFYKCTSLVRVPGFNMAKATSLYRMFYGCACLETIGAITTNNATMTDVFAECYSILSSNIVSPTKAHNYSASTLFSVASLVEILTNLGTVSVATTLTLGPTNLAKLDATQKQIALDKGWTLA